MRKGFAAGVMTAVLCLSAGFSSMAASSISSISLEISSDIAAGDTDSSVDVESDSGKYSVDSVTVTNEPDDEWEEGDKPKLKVTLSAESGYSFSSSLKRSDVDLDGDDGTVTSVTRNGSSKFTVYITLEALDDEEDSGDYELDVADPIWDESDGYAYWDSAEDAKKYEVKLYRGSTLVTTVTTTRDYYNFGSYFTQSGTYRFKVRAVYNSSNKGEWETSDSWYVSSSEASEIRSNSSSSSGGSSSGPGDTGTSAGPGADGQAGGAWLKDSTGWWYCYADKTYPANQWAYIDNCWYFFNSSGYMETGWISWNGAWYYCSSSGVMLTNTYTPDGYYVGADGAWIS